MTWFQVSRSGRFLSSPAAWFRRGGRLRLAPEGVVVNALAGGDLLPRSIQDGAKARRVGHQQALDLLLVFHADDHADSPAVPGDHDRPALAGFEVRAEPGLDLRNRRDLHS